MTLFARLVTVAAAAMAVVSGEHIQYKIRNGELASRAVNIGGWLVSEYWMCFTSPLYDGVPSSVGLDGEYAVMKHLGKAQATKQFEKHWKTFITEDDLADIAAAGLNTVRVTTGFWIMNDNDTSDQSALTQSYPAGGLKYLDKLINVWAVKYNLAVMISLHAHRGSQNGFDNSAPEKAGTIGWSSDPANVQSSLNYATWIAHRYKNSPAFLGLNLMNEPRRPTDYNVLKKYYLDAYEAIRADGNDCIIATSPWLENQGPPTMDDFMTCPEYYNVWHEWHLYFKWGWEGVSKDAMLASAATYADSHLKPWKGNPMYMGEWSLATTDEVNLSKAELTNFANSQMQQYDDFAMGGWAFWSWRHDEETKKNVSGWSLRQLIKENIVVVPSTPANRTRDPKCKAVFSHDNSSASESTEAGSASGNGSASPVELIKPESSKSQATTAPSLSTSAPTPTSAAVPVLPTVMAFVVATIAVASVL